MKVIVITNRNAATVPFFLQMDRIIAAKPDMMVLKEADMAYRIYAKFLKQAKATCDEYMVDLCADTYYDAATRMMVDNIYMTMENLRVCSHTLRPLKVWASVSSPEEAKEAVSLDACNIIAGNVFASETNPSAPAIGLDVLKKICEAVNVPVYAAGGITPENASAVAATGVKGVCVTSSVMIAEKPADVIDALRKNLK